MAVARRHAGRHRSLLLVLVLAAVTLITLDDRGGRTGALGALGRAAHTVMSPVERGVSAVAQPVSDWWDGLVHSGRLKQQDRDLRAEVARLKGEEARWNATRAENETLSRLLRLPVLADVPRVNARVVNRDPGDFESTLTIDHGTERGLAVGMPVLAPDGLVGRVVEAWRGGAKVRVLVDAKSGAGVTTLQLPGHDATTGIAQGQAGSHELLVDDFDDTKPVGVGDQIVTSGVENSDFPPGLLVGTVAKVDRLPAGLGLRVRVAPYVDFAGVTYVAVLRWVPGQGPVVSTATTSSTTVPSAPTPSTPSTASTPSTSARRGG